MRRARQSRERCRSRRAVEMAALICRCRRLLLPRAVEEETGAGASEVKWNEGASSDGRVVPRRQKAGIALTVKERRRWGATRRTIGREKTRGRE